MLDGIPKPLIVAAVLIAGIVLFIAFQPPHRQCQAQVEMLQKLQQGKLFPSPPPNARGPSVMRELERCKLGNSPGACFEFFTTLRKLNRDLSGLPNECSEDLMQIGIVQGSIREGLLLLTQVAWGESAPAASVGGITQGWLEPSDMALFCGLKDTYQRIYGSEALTELRNGIFSMLPGEAPVIENGVCTNCEYRKKALEMLTPEEIRARSLFAARCERFR